MRNLFTAISLLVCVYWVHAQDTTIIQTITYDSTGRDYMFQFPAENGTTYRKILMQYSMRCKDGLISTAASPNDHGCGEWDYSCNTFITDSSKTDSTLLTHPSHVITSFTGTSYPYTTIPTYTYYQYNQQAVTYNSTVSESSASIGAANELLEHPFKTAQAVAKTQYLWTAAELLNAGLVAGNVTGIQLNVLDAMADAQFLKIRIKSTTQTVLNEALPEIDGFTEVYFLNTHLVDGLNRFNFHQAYNWDGTSNLLLELSYTNATPSSNSVVEGHDAGALMALTSIGTDQFLEFSSIGQVDISQSDYSAVQNEITVQFWAYGNAAALPRNTSAFEATDSQNRRQVHAHLPWENSRVYWDCGNDGSYDRIDKAAITSNLEGKWNHWAFVKNASTGSMKIYLNGVQWHSGTSKTKSISIDQFKFGNDVASNYPYFGYIDNFSVWNKALTQSEIQQGMYKSEDASHPQYAYLINFFNLNQNSGNLIFDASPNHISGVHSGLPTWKMHRGESLFKEFSGSTFRPNITFYQGVYDQTTNPQAVLDSVLNNPNMVYSYTVSGTNLVPVDTQYYYLASPSNIYDQTGAVVGTVPHLAVDTIDITSLSYYEKYPSNFEIMSFVTPYGLGLDLGMGGKTWQFDVSDLAPILKGRKRMFFTGGVYQEDLDIKFLFIEGTPVRDVIDVQQIWRAGQQYNYTDLMNNIYFEPRMVPLNSSASAYKIRAAITGHGQEGEFIPRTHFLNINGGANEFTWQVWKACADNPIYPQGGTWVYDRAGWCPGKATDTKEFEISSMVSPGQTVEIDYGVTNGSGDSRYIINCQLVSYGLPNYTLDAEIVEVQRPSQRIVFGRVNPVCYHPTIVIRNTGSTTLNSLNIEYGVSGGNPLNYTWTGNLEFNQTATVNLPIPDAAFWLGDDQHIFTAEINQPNGGSDGYSDNNIYHSPFDLPDMYAEPFIVFLRTNSRGYENYYQIKDVSGQVIFSKTGLTSSTTYRDTMDLAPGCYTLELFDSGEDGLEWWANTAQGTGYFRLFNVANGALIKNFETDFGSEFRYSFVVDNYTNIESQGKSVPEIEVFPNPTTGEINVSLNFVEHQAVEISISDMSGKLIEKLESDGFNQQNINFDLSGEASGVYVCKIKTKDQIITRKIVLQKP